MGRKRRGKGNRKSKGRNRVSSFQSNLNQTQSLLLTHQFKGLDKNKIDWEYDRKNRELEGVYQDTITGISISASASHDRKGVPYEYDSLVYVDSDSDGYLDKGIYYVVDVDGRYGFNQHVINANKLPYQQTINDLTAQAFASDSGQGLADFFDSLPGVSSGNSSTGVGIIVNKAVAPLVFA